mmetsp:Transcript_146871/g.256440  ORF Transcript_146871/g.256440 Transcript_146871/m.256440 type:complete len:211 (-) Transcript_146871:122-754(-)
MGRGGTWSASTTRTSMTASGLIAKCTARGSTYTSPPAISTPASGLTTAGVVTGPSSITRPSTCTAASGSQVRETASASWLRGLGARLPENGRMGRCVATACTNGGTGMPTRANSKTAACMVMVCEPWQTETTTQDIGRMTVSMGQASTHTPTVTSMTGRLPRAPAVGTACTTKQTAHDMKGTGKRIRCAVRARTTTARRQCPTVGTGRTT